jgi:hypothetical protein
MFKRFFILSVSLFFLAESCFAQGSPDSIIKNLPASYVGTYEWEGDPDIWNVTVSFSERSAGNNGEVRLVGVEHFVNRRDKVSPELTNINATWTGSQGKRVILKLRASEH